MTLHGKINDEFKLKKMFWEIFFFITLYPLESELEPGAGAAKIEEPGAAKNGRLRNTVLDTSLT